MDIGYIQLTGIIGIFSLAGLSLFLGNAEFAKDVGLVGIGVVGGFLGNEAIQ